MKTVEEFYKEYAESKELQSELKTASDEMLGAFLKKHGCDADVKEYIAFANSHTEGEIEDSEAAAVAGGTRPMYSVSESDHLKELADFKWFLSHGFL